VLTRCAAERFSLRGVDKPGRLQLLNVSVFPPKNRVDTLRGCVIRVRLRARARSFSSVKLFCAAVKNCVADFLVSELMDA